MHAKKIKTLLAVMIIVLAAGIYCLRTFELPPRLNPQQPHLALGEALADQAVKLAGGGGRITLIAPDITLFKYPGAELQLKAFHGALRKAGSSVAVTNLIRLDPLRLMRVPPGDFVEILRKKSETDVVVSLLSPSELTAEQQARLPEKRPHVIAVCSGETPRQVNLKSLFDERALEVVVISRAVPSPNTPPTDNLPDWFGAYFQMITSKNLNDLPAFSAAGR